MVAVRNLQKILRPDSVAVIGASNKPAGDGSIVLENLIAGGFEGAIYPIHRHHRRIQGLTAFPTIADLPEKADLAVVCTPPEAVPDVVRQCGEAGIGGVAILSAGFREVGATGHELERQISYEAARFPELRMLGPNSLGIIVPDHKLNASFSGEVPKAGRLAFISQSRTICTAALDWAIQEGIGFSHFVSIGNMLEVGLGDLIDYFAADPFTKAIILYVESITEARHFMSAARAITQDKPIVVYKAGRFSQSAKAAVSHTGTLSGVDAVYEAAFERAGIVRVFEIDEMFHCARLLARSPRSVGRRLAIITNSGGPGVVATDCLIDRQGVLARFSADTIEQLNQFLPSHWSRANPANIRGDASPERFARAIELVSDDPNVDAVLVVLTPQAMTDPTGTGHAVSDVAARGHKPILAVWMGGGAVREGIDVLRRAGVPTYSTLSSAVNAFMQLVSYSRRRETLRETPRDVPVSFPEDRERQKELLGLVAGSKQQILSEELSKRLLGAYGISATQPQLARSPDEAAGLARDIGYPVVLKVVSPQISHKNEVGGVALNLGSDDEVRAVFARIVDSLKWQRPTAHIHGVSVQPMAAAPNGVEMILGSRKDAVFGAVILIGAGGVAAELLQDFTLGLPPLNERLARRMLESLRIWPIIAGRRRRPAASIERLVETLIRFSYLIADCPQIAEMDVNPLLVAPNEVIALDARVRLDRRHQPDARPFSHLAIRPYPEHLVRRATLRDGTPVILRPIRPEDEPLWHEMLLQCSTETLRGRFRSLFRQMTHEMAARFCFIDYDRELAIVAEATHGPQRQLIGVGHLICNADHTNAEYAVLVPDAWQRRGVGSLITKNSVEIAADWGLSLVIGETERLNRGMISTFKAAGFDFDYDTDPEVVIVRKQLGRPMCLLRPQLPVVRDGEKPGEG